jgi:peptidoglycan/xylan/chitin deacetylase (PgdA/CDA1 family)
VPHLQTGLILGGGCALAAGTALATTAYAALSPGSRIFGPVVTSGDNPDEFALTYDDGPNDRATPHLLEVLARHQVRATFFCIGRFVRQRPDLVRAVRDAGHLIGNHTQTHPWLAWQSAARIRQELSDCNHALEDALGEPVRLMRPPHGARRPFVFRAASELGLSVVNWNVMAFDWREEISAEQVSAYARRGAASARGRGRAANVLLHDGFDMRMGADRSATVEATDRLLNEWRAAGLRSVTVDAWLPRT